MLATSLQVVAGVHREFFCVFDCCQISITITVNLRMKSAAEYTGCTPSVLALNTARHGNTMKTETGCFQIVLEVMKLQPEYHAKYVSPSKPVSACYT